MLLLFQGKYLNIFKNSDNDTVFENSEYDYFRNSECLVLILKSIL